MIFEHFSFYYPGNPIFLVLFSIVSFTLLFSGFYKKISYGYLFLVIFLWFGFWLKLAAFTFWNQTFTESIGSFSHSPESWDRVLLIATLAFISILTVRFTFLYYFKGISTFTIDNPFEPPQFYIQYRPLIWPFAFIGVLALSIVNITFGIHQVGLSPRTIFPWPLNAMIAFLLNIGLALGLVTILFWETMLTRRLGLLVLVNIIEGFLVSASMLSRSIFIFRLIPLLAVIFYNQVWLKFKRFNLLLLALVIFLVVSISVSSIFRSYLFPTQNGLAVKDQRLIRLEILRGGIENVKKLIAQGEHQEQHLRELENEQNQLLEEIRISNQSNASSFLGKIRTDFFSDLSEHLRYKAVPQIYNLVVGRFVGLEGLMAMEGYSNKSLDTFASALTERRSSDKVTFYQSVAQSNYQAADTNVWQFASLPGAIAFLFYSGSYLVVILGMIFFTFLLILIEYSIFKHTGNSFLCALVGINMANHIAQFGITPRQDLPYLSLILFSILIIVFVSKKRKSIS